MVVKPFLGFHSGARVGEVVRRELPCLPCWCRQQCGQWLLLGACRSWWGAEPLAQQCCGVTPAPRVVCTEDDALLEGPEQDLLGPAVLPRRWLSLALISGSGLGSSLCPRDGSVCSPGAAAWCRNGAPIPAAGKRSCRQRDPGKRGLS